MRKAIIFLGIAAAALSASAAVADPPGQHKVTVRNDTGARVECAIHKDGSSITDTMLLKAGQIWTIGYGGDKPRWFRCDGAYTDWQRLAPEGVYSLVDTGGRLIVKPAPH
jgi:hypothetical protein